MCRPKSPSFARWCRRHGLGGVFIPGALVLAMGCANSHFWGEMPTANALRPNAQDAPPAVAPQQADEHGMRQDPPPVAPLQPAEHSPPPQQPAAAQRPEEHSPQLAPSIAPQRPEEQTPPRPTQSPASLLAPTPAPERPQEQPVSAVPQLREELLPAPQAKSQVAKLGFAMSDPGKMVPITLDAVLRLAETQNGQTAIAREKLQEAFANQDVAAKAWLPDLWVGGSYYRHEGGISNEDGTITRSSFGSLFGGMELGGRLDLRESVYKRMDAQRQVWQQRAEVAKLSSESLLEASSTYVDLLSARAAETITLKMKENLEDLLKQAMGLAKALPAAEVEVARIQTDLHGQEILLRKFREGGEAASAKLIYLLGLDPASELVIADRNLVAFDLVNVDQPAAALVEEAKIHGPGIQELGGLLATIQEAAAKDSGLNQLLPVVDVRLAEGWFGTGPGERLDTDNRFDFGVAVRWNLTEWVTHRDRVRATQAKIGQAHASYQDLIAKLSMGVHQSRETVLSSRDQLTLGVQALRHATDAYDRSKNRLAKSPNLAERSPSEVLLSIRALNASHLAYLQAIRDHDKAQLRLAILTGMMGVGRDH